MLDGDVLEHLRVPSVHWKATRDQIPDSCFHKSHVESYIKHLRTNLEKPCGLLLWGEYGTGKSAIAAICLKAAFRLGKVGMWVNARELPSFYKEGTLFDEHQTMKERMNSVPLLVIDEVTLAEDSFHNLNPAVSLVEVIVRIRQDNRLPTILTSNDLPKQFATHTPHLHHVMLECVTPIRVYGHDFRKAMLK